MILLALCYLFWRAVFWCFAAMIWLCLASAAWMLVLMMACLTIWLDRRFTVNLLAVAAKIFAPPRYLRIKSHA